MFDDLLPAVTLFAVITTGLLAGVYFTFSAFMMRALDRLPPAQGASVMQTINVVIINPAFMLVFIGSAAAGAVLAISAPFRWSDPGTQYLLAGSLLCLVGSLLVTGIFNVPLNDTLAAVTPGSTGSETVWTDYVRTWTAWNHVRTASSIGATVLLSLAFRAQGA